MDQGRYGEEKDREESSYQGSYGAQAESWVCPTCETVNTQDKCVVCGYQKEHKEDNVKSEKKKRPRFVWAIAVCLVAVVFLALSALPKSGASNTLMPSGIEATVFGSDYPREHIGSVTFLTTAKDAPADSWDVSENRNGAVLAWVKRNGALYDLFIGAEGGVVAPEDCTCLFLDYKNLRQIEFNDAFDTANVTSMSSMFDGCSSLSKLDVSNFDTANVTDMYAMFDNCNSLATLDVSGFDTTNVMDMGGMFGNCNSLTELDVSGFDTANVTSMYAMFYNCSHLSELDASHFDTSNVTNMGFMFCGCSNLTELDVSHFNVSKVVDCENFMDYGRTINGHPWEEFFRTQ